MVDPVFSTSRHRQRWRCRPPPAPVCGPCHVSDSTCAKSAWTFRVGQTTYDQRREGWGERYGGAKPIIGHTLCLEGGTSTTHTSMTSEATTSNLMTSNEGEATRARAWTLLMRKLILWVCVRLWKKRTFLLRFFFCDCFQRKPSRF